MTRDAQREILGEEGAAFARQHRAVQRRELLLQFRPGVAERNAERVRMLLAEHRQIAVVVDEDEVRPPAHRHRELRGEDRRDDQLEARRPAFARAERRARPIVAGDPRGHFATQGPVRSPGTAHNRHSAC